MKWSYRLALAGLAWALLTFLLSGAGQCGAYDDFCGVPFAIANPPVFLSAITLMLLDLPTNGIPFFNNAFLTALLLDGIFGYFLGMIIDRRNRRVRQ